MGAGGFCIPGQSGNHGPILVAGRRNLKETGICALRKTGVKFLLTFIAQAGPQGTFAPFKFPEGYMAQTQAAQIEYTIYTFDMPVPKQKSSNSWKKHATLADMGQAMTEAQSLLETRKYQKIEVKKKFFDQKKNRVVDMTLKTYETTPKKDFTTVIAVVMALLGALGAFAASFFLSK